MCITVNKDKKVPESGRGWKVFGVTNRGRLRFHIRTEAKLIRGKWMKAKQREIGFTQPYMSGFHVYLTKPYDTRNPYRHAKIVSVRFKGGRVVGTQDYRSVVVADYLFIPKSRVKKK